MGNKQTCAQTRDQLENLKRIKTEQSSSRSLLQHTETKKKKKTTPSTFLQSNTHSREFSITQKSSRRTPPNLSLSTHCKQRSFAIPPHTTLSLSLLSPSLLPLMVASSNQSGRVLGIAPPDHSGYQIRQPSSSKNKIPGLIYTRGESNNQLPGYFTPPWLSKTQIPGYFTPPWLSKTQIPGYYT